MEYLKIIIWILTLFHMMPAHAEGFAGGTLIKTTSGYTAIEHIKIGDQIVSGDAQQEYVAGMVINIVKKSIDQYACISITDEYLCVAPDQQSYDESNDSW